jgi:arylsulfatase A-like enzyme
MTTARPNILLVHSHDLGRHLGCYGIPTLHTPHLDAFAAEGVLFTQSFCSAPGCSPSRAALFTGRYPHSNGVMGLCHAQFAWDLNPAERHLASCLAGAGYATAAVGILHETSSGPARCGYQHYDPDNRAVEATTAAIRRLGQLAAAQPAAPFFLSVGYFEPHRLPGPESDPPGEHGFTTSYFGPDEELGVTIPPYLAGTPGTRVEMAELQGAVRHVDAQFGRLMQAVADLGLAHNTLVIFTSDHGIAMPRAKCTLYDPGIGVALLVRLPSRPGWNGGIRRAELIPNIDILPTLLDLSGIPLPPAVQGRSFAPLLDGGAYTPHAEIYPETTYHGYYDPRRAVRTAAHKLIVNFSSAFAIQDPSQRWRPRSDIAGDQNPAMLYTPDIELYDLRADPAENRNLAGDPAWANLRQELLARLKRHMVETDDPLLRGAVASPQHSRAITLLDSTAPA